MNALILGAIICTCAALYAIWRTQMEVLKVLRQINIKALNGAYSAGLQLSTRYA